MTIFALVVDDFVENIVEAESLQILEALVPDMIVVQESESSGIAWIGSEVINDRFKPPQPYSSWTFDDMLFEWIAPMAYPNDGTPYSWNEETQSWDQIQINEE